MSPVAPRAFASSAWPLFLLAAITAFVTRDHLAGGVYLDHDWYTMHLADALHVQAAQAEGAWTALWSPYLLGGTPLYGVATKPFSYPPFLLGVAVWGAERAMNLLMALHLLVAAWGTYRLARRIDCSEAASLGAGLALLVLPMPARSFAALPYGMGYAMAWWAWAWVALLDLLERRGSQRGAAWRLGLFAALQWHAGGEATLYGFVGASLLLALPWGRAGWGCARGRWWLSALVFLGAIAFQALPEWCWISASGRGTGLSAQETLNVTWAYGDRAEERWTRLPLFAEHVWARYQAGSVGGWLPASLASGIAFALVGICTRSKGRAVPLGLLLAAAGPALVASGVFHEELHRWLPGYGLQRQPIRFFQVSAWALLLVGAWGWSSLGRERTQARAPWIWVAWLLVGLALLATRTPRAQLESAESSEAALAEFFAAVKEDPGRPRFYQATHRSQAAWIRGGLPSLAGALGGLGSEHRRYLALLGSHRPARDVKRERSPLLDVLGVGYLAGSGSGDPTGLERVGDANTWTRPTLRSLHERGWPTVLWARGSTQRPLAMWVPAHQWVQGSPEQMEDFWSALLRPGSGYQALQHVLLEWPQGEPVTTSVLSAEDLAPVLEAQLATTVATVERTSDRWVLDVTSHSAGTLLLAETLALHGGWRARIDGRAAPLYVADGMATALVLPDGARRVELHYTPPGRLLGVSLSGLAILLALLLSRRSQSPSST